MVRRTNSVERQTWGAAIAEETIDIVSAPSCDLGVLRSTPMTPKTAIMASSMHRKDYIYSLSKPQSERRTQRQRDPSCIQQTILVVR